MLLKLRWYCLMLLLPCSAVSAQEKISKSRLDSLFTALDTHHQAMGSVAISRNGRLLYTRAIGISRYEGKKGVPANSETAYRIGSITKMFTAVIAFQLMEEKKLSPETRLSQYFPQIPNADRITIAMMMGHRSGIYNFTADTTYLDWNTQPFTRKQIIDKVLAHRPSFPPDSATSYSNTNYVLLGYILSDITGKPYAQLVKERITDRIGLRRTMVGGKIAPARNEAGSFSWNGKAWEAETETDASVSGAAGSIISTPSDLLKFVEALFGGRLISAASLREMTTLRGALGTEVKNGLGMGIFQFPFNEKRGFGHTGGIDEFHAMVTYFPKDSLGVAFCTNGLVYGMNDIMIGVLSIAFNRPYAIPSFDTKTVDIPAAVLAGYEGVYATTKMPMKITVKKDGHNLTAQATGQGAFPLEAVSETEFQFASAGIKLVFTESVKGAGYDRLLLKQAGSEIPFTREH